MKIEFLYFEGCPSSEPAYGLLRECLKERSLLESIDIQKVIVKTPEKAAELHFLGSPSIRVNGFDIEKQKNEDFAFSCRIYEEGGKKSGIPSKNLINKALEESI